jgi:TP901 family phage tail tape measure protein
VAAESNVGARLLLIGKDGVLAGIREITTATANLNRTIAAGADSSKVAAAGYAEQGAGLEALGAKMELYQTQLGAVSAETDALARVGKVAFYSFAAAGAAWTFESIKWAQSYQTELIRLRTQAGLTVGAMNAVGAAAMKNAAALGTTPTAYLQAAYHPASTQMSTQQVISITNYAAMASAISGAPLEDTTNAITGVMKAYGYKGSGEHTTALLNAIVGAGNMRFADLNSALGSGIASVAKTYGVSLTSMGGALARLTDVGTPPAMAGTHLRMALALLGAPTSKSAKLLTAAGMGTSQASGASSAMASALVAAGLNTTEVSAALRDNSGAGGIYNALELLHRGLTAGGLSPQLQGNMISSAFGGGKMGTAILQLYSNLPALQRKSGQISGNATNQRFMSDWADTTKTLNFQLHRLGGELQTIGTAFGKDVLPGVTEGIKVFTNFLDVIGKNKALIVALGGAITAVLVPAIAVYLKRALLSSQGSIMAVLNAYKRLILGQTEEDASLARMDAALAANDAALRTNAAAARTDGLSPLAGAAPKITKAAPVAAGMGGSGVLGLAALGGGIYAAARDTKAILAGKAAWDPLHITKYVRGTEINHGLAVGFDYGRHQIAHAASSLWDDLTDHHPTTTPPRTRAHIVAHVYIDGKQVTATVKQNVKRTANRQ